MFSDGVIKTRIYVSIGTVSTRVFGKMGFSIIFRQWAPTFRLSIKKFLNGVLKTAFYVSIGTTWWKGFDFFLYQYPTLGENFSSVSRKKLAGISELLSKSSYDFFEENIIPWNNRYPDFFQTWVENFLISVKFFRRGFQNCYQ